MRTGDTRVLERVESALGDPVVGCLALLDTRSGMALGLYVFANKG